MTCALAGVVLGAGASAASAYPMGSYIAWSLDGGGGAYTATGHRQPLAFPRVSVTSTSGAPASVGTGASTWIPEDTGFGSLFGSSRDQMYLSLRPAADDPTSPSVTTFTFAEPTPVGRWGLALGDIDDETLEVAGTDADGKPLTGAEVGLVDTFSACDAASRAPDCDGESAPYALPTATVGADRVTLEDTRCPTDPAGCDTAGASAWVSPTVPVRSLTVTSTWRAGTPAFDAWLATETRWIQGAIDPTPDVAYCAEVPGGATLFTADGRYIAAESGSDGANFQFGGLYPGVYVLRIDIPDTWALEDPADAVRTLDVTRGNALDIVPRARPTSGRVTVHVQRTYQDPSPGATVRLVRGTTVLGPVLSDTDGNAVMGQVPVGRWTIVVTPAGSSHQTTQRLDLACDWAQVDVTIVPGGNSTPPPAPPPTPGAPGQPATGQPVAARATAGALAATGTDPAPSLRLAAALLLLGTGLLAWSRRRVT